MHLWQIALAVLAINIPFGYWRAAVKRFSRSWFLAIHIPVAIAICLRILSKLGWHFETFPVMVGVFCLGQFIGGRLCKFRQGRTNARRQAS